jgi:hypothetical protein
VLLLSLSSCSRKHSTEHLTGLSWSFIAPVATSSALFSDSLLQLVLLELVQVTVNSLALMSHCLVERIHGGMMPSASGQATTTTHRCFVMGR